MVEGAYILSSEGRKQGAEEEESQTLIIKAVVHFYLNLLSSETSRLSPRVLYIKTAQRCAIF